MFGAFARRRTFDTARANARHDRSMKLLGIPASFVRLRSASCLRVEAVTFVNSAER